MSTRTHEKDTGGFRYISVKPAKIAQMEQKDLLFAQRPSEQTVSLRREFERSGNYAERIHFGPRIFNTREWDVQRKWDPKRKASAVADAFLFGGPEGIRTLDLSDANRTRSQLRYRPVKHISVKSAFLIYNICGELSRAFSSVQKFFALFICLCLSARCAATNGGSIKLRKRVGAEQSILHTGKDICPISFSTR